jgi:hypothetical protein
MKKIEAGESWRAHVCVCVSVCVCVHVCRSLSAGFEKGRGDERSKGKCLYVCVCVCVLVCCLCCVYMAFGSFVYHTYVIMYSQGCGSIPSSLSPFLSSFHSLFLPHHTHFHTFIDVVSLFLSLFSPSFASLIIFRTVQPFILTLWCVCVCVCLFYFLVTSLILLPIFS